MGNMMKGKVAIVTGAGGGIGREIALAMAAEGAKVVVNDIGTSTTGEGADKGPAQKVVDEIESRGGQAVASTDSVANWDGASGIVKTAIEKFGRVDAVVNNAGILRDRMFFKMNPEEWQAVIDVHLSGAFYVSRAAATYFREQESGAYVHMTSSTGLIGNVGQANYGAAKGGIVSLSKVIALDMARHNVRSNIICPFAWSRMTGSIPTDTPESKARVEKTKLMQAAQIAPMAVFLCTDAAKEVNAQVFAVRANEIMLMSQPRPVRSVHHAGGWTPQAIADHALPALKPGFYGLDVSGTVFTWDPVI
ncbi:SDR family NAD(P)-dependent oxidoreductase [Ramlibacter sp.]|uniref:SDR family NAD(P)-dependent oxidoreductase n=1 Tax=Ramlibacter sp. TaxID=1917967 RepID=UPI003D0FBC27